MLKLENQKKEFVLQMGELQVCEYPAIISCFRLGSCVGLFLYDKLNKIGGGAHIMFANKVGADKAFPKSFYANYALEELLQKMAISGADTTQLQAKLVGGANLLGMENFSIGKRNTETILHLLENQGVTMAGTDLGGSIGRTAKFHTKDGRVFVSSQLGNYIV